MKGFKAIIGIAFALTIVGALLVSGFTAASFTSTAQDEDTIFVSGDMEVTLDRSDGEPYFDLSNIAPGDSGSEEIVVSNTGSIDMAYVLSLSYSGSLVEGENPLTFSVYDSDGNILDLMSERELLAGEQEVLVIAWQMPKEAGNEYQNASAELDIKVVAEQLETKVGLINP